MVGMILAVRKEWAHCWSFTISVAFHVLNCSRRILSCLVKWNGATGNFESLSASRAVIALENGPRDALSFLKFLFSLSSFFFSTLFMIKQFLSSRGTPISVILPKADFSTESLEFHLGRTSWQTVWFSCLAQSLLFKNFTINLTFYNLSLKDGASAAIKSSQNVFEEQYLGNVRSTSLCCKAGEHMWYSHCVHSHT